MNKMKNTQIFTHCTVCGQKLSGQDSQILSGRGDSFLTHISCPNCLTASVALTSGISAEGNLVSMGMLVDLDVEEARKFFSQKPMRADEVLEVYETLSRL